ncbi:integral membrane sensor signal transduction histidine kinase [Methylocella silvestris BL2]|uniref:histidine kinase n=1 Tax=Methylocella silvestris (strain DSM 15510 / CIP 108128 / LMG 27833 / NCIMB 13906 / BL2) TaxID=395965 RepID=B8EJK5_METSB|nr:ATP-binding protein [Methylocella silvestris]ACK49409.1 integral membrane sensor signal transduction histidine kinase [Methylocella silvestris BL2]
MSRSDPVAGKASGWAASRISIAKRLFLSAAILSFAILFLAGALLTAVYRQAAERNFDERLNVYLRALITDIATASEADRAGPDELSDPQFALALSGWYWQITRLDGDQRQIRSSRSLFAARLPRLSDLGVPVGIGGARQGYAKGPDDRRLRIVERIVDAGDDGIYLVQVGATTAELESAIEQFEAYLTVTFTLLALALIASSALQLRYGLAPLRQLREGVAAIRRGEAESISGVYPLDLAPLAGELNLLIGANRAVVERARTQVGNLAHALKTPLSVVINEAALEPGPLSAKVAEQAAIMRDQVGYYLDRARAAVRAGMLTGSTEVEPVIRALLAAFEKIYADRALEFSLDAPSPIRFLGEKQDLEEMIGNLIDNAGKWARGSVNVTVAAETPDPDAERSFFHIVIDDDGLGLPADRREEAIARGRRLDETKPGSGLGLSIVVDLATMYGGGLTLDASPAGGLRAQLRLPSTQNPPEPTRS